MFDLRAGAGKVCLTDMNVFPNSRLAILSRPELTISQKERVTLAAIFLAPHSFTFT